MRAARNEPRSGIRIAKAGYVNGHSIVIQKFSGRPEQLILLFHGMGGSPDGLVPLGRRLASAFPGSTVVSVAAPHPSGNSGGREWFSAAGITEASRIGRVEQAMPAFLAQIREWQQSADVTPTATALAGFSQGAIMSLEASVTPSPPAGRVIAIAGRFARLPEHAPSHATIHLLHGKEDPVIPYRHTIDAAHRLRELGGDVTADVVPFTGHEISGAIADLAAERLLGHVPKRMWDEALRTAESLPRS
jgi:phospholipase/carboxylesterase